MAADIRTDCASRKFRIYASIANLAQTLEVFLCARGRKEAIEAPGRAAAAGSIPNWSTPHSLYAKSGKLWEDLEKGRSDRARAGAGTTGPPAGRGRGPSIAICLAFAEIIDSKTPFTYRHSVGVADVRSIWRATSAWPAENCESSAGAGLCSTTSANSASPTPSWKNPGKLTAEEFS